MGTGREVGGEGRGRKINIGCSYQARVGEWVGTEVSSEHVCRRALSGGKEGEYPGSEIGVVKI